MLFILRAQYTNSGYSVPLLRPVLGLRNRFSTSSLWLFLHDSNIAVPYSLHPHLSFPPRSWAITEHLTVYGSIPFARQSELQR